MKNNVIFSFAFLILFIASCTKTSVVSISDTISEEVVKTRTNVAVNATVSGIIITDGIMEFTGFDTDLSGLSIAATQNLNFTNDSGGTVSVQVEVTSFEIIITDGIMEFSDPGVNLEGLEIDSNQTLLFE